MTTVPNQQEFATVMQHIYKCSSAPSSEFAFISSEVDCITRCRSLQEQISPTVNDSLYSGSSCNLDSWLVENKLVSEHILFQHSKKDSSISEQPSDNLAINGDDR